MRLRLRLDAFLAVLLVGLLATVFAVSRGSTLSSAAAAPSPLASASAFGRSYLGYLTGAASSSDLAGSTQQVQAIAAGLGPIPSPARAGQLRLTGVQLRYVRGTTSASALLTGQDRRHSYRFGINLGYNDGRWEVVYLVPPDLAMDLAPHHISPPPSIPASAHIAAARFALAYAAFRKGSAGSPPPGLPPILGQIRSGSDPLASASPRHVRPTLVSLGFGPPNGGVVVAAPTVTDAGQRLSFSFVLKLAGGRWQAWEFPGGAR